MGTGWDMKFLTYAAPAIRSARTDCIRAAFVQFEQQMELYAALNKLTARKQTYLLCRYGFTDGV